MKTFVSDKYQATLRDNGSFEVILIGALHNRQIIYNPNKKIPWYSIMICTGRGYGGEYISDLMLSKSALEVLHEALEVIGKQDLMDNEIVFVNKTGEIK